MRRFDVMIGGECRTNLTEHEVEVLFKLGQVNRQTGCRTAGRLEWQTIDECLPLLKYIRRTTPPMLPSVAPLIPVATPSAPVISRGDPTLSSDERARSSLTSSLKTGWICFGLGAAVAWIFPPAFVFYSAALIMAIVGMCTRQVSRGLILFLSSFVAMGTSAFLSMILAVGVFAVAVNPATDEAQRVEKDIGTRMQRPQTIAARTMHQSGAPSSRPAVPLAEPAQPVVGYPPASLSQHELMDEIHSVEAKQRQLRRTGRDLDQLTSDYLTNLRVELDKRTVR